MQIRQNISLRPYNTFGIEAKARYFSTFSNVAELLELLQSPLNAQSTPLILGGGSNILLTKDVDRLVLKNDIKGIDVIQEDEEAVYVKAGAGEVWHRLVRYCVEQDYAGLENLSLIPGSTGASPMQNIGAYGVEIKDIFHSLEALHVHEHVLKTFTPQECAFGYRESVFKRHYKGHFVITSVTFRLRKKPVFQTGYGALQQELEKMGVKELSVKAISQAVINIRRSKLPDPNEVGNAGSFFKNPQVRKQELAALQKLWPDIPFYPFDATHVKVPAGWLIEQCGWKGYRNGDAGCYAKQALVLVNYGNATGKEVYALSEEILQSVNNRFSILLEREVNVI